MSNISISAVYYVSVSISLRFWFRLYWFPLKVLYATCVSSLQSVPDIPFYFFFNALLLVLLLMNIYWFLVRKPRKTVCMFVLKTATTMTQSLSCLPTPMVCVVHSGFRGEGAKDEGGK